MTTDDSEATGKPTPIRGEVVPAVVSYADDVMERCYELWAGRTARNNRATARLYAAEVEPGTPTPTYETIRTWAARHHWEERRRADYERNHGESLYDIQLDTLALMRRSVDVMAEAQSGAYDDNPAAGIVRLKAGELVGKIVERGILPLMPKPRDLPLDTDSMSREDAEAHAMQAIARGRKGHTG